MRGLEGDVGLAGVGGFAVGSGVHAEHADVTGVAGPHPVVGVAAELADGAGRGAHQAHVAVGLVDEDVELVALEHHLEVGAQAVLLAHGLLQAAGHLLDLGVAVIVAHAVVQFGGHRGGDVLDALQEAHAEAGGQLVLAGHGPETVGEVVVLHAAQALDGVIAAVVVGEEEPFVAHHLAAAETTAQAHHGVLQATAVDGVNVLCGELEPELLHLGLVDLFQLGEQPHAFVGLRGDHQTGCKQQR